MVFLKVALILAAIFVAVILTLSKKDGKESFNENNIKVRGWGLATGVAIFLAVLMLVGSIGQVPAGHRGVVLNFGAVTTRTLGEGIYVVTPIANSVVIMDVQVRDYVAHASAASKDLQDASTNITLNYYLDPGKVNETYRTLRQDVLQRIVTPAVQEAVKANTAKFNAEELITKRPEVKAAIEKDLKDRLAFHGIIVEAVSITDFKFSPSFTLAIDAKVSAGQRALEAEAMLRQIEVEAKQVQAAAIGQANAAIAAAEGDAKATLTRAEAQAKANEMLAKSLKDQPELLKYILYQTIGPDIKVIVLPNGQEFILGPDIINPSAPAAPTTPPAK